MSAQFGSDVIVVATSGGSRVVYSCVACGALVAGNKAPLHEAWHEQLDEHEIAEAAGAPLTVGRIQVDPVPPELIDRIVNAVSAEIRKLQRVQVGMTHAEALAMARGDSPYCGVPLPHGQSYLRCELVRGHAGPHALRDQGA